MVRASSRRPRGIDALVARALAEDRAGLDRTTRALLPRGVPAVAVVTAEAEGVLSGIAAARAIARRQRVSVLSARRDGDRLRPGRRVLALRGDARAILSLERTLLNFLMHASGVATATRRAVAVGGGGPRRLEVWATRKTLPGLRDLEKAAVTHGGGRPHRRDLSDTVLVKNNHLAVVPLPEAVRRLRARLPSGTPIEVEVRSVAEALRAARAGATSLLLDNQSPAAARRIVRALERAGVRRDLWLELSGGLTPQTLGRYRKVGADAASLGSITHSAAAVPFHLELHPLRLRRPSH